MADETRATPGKMTVDDVKPSQTDGDARNLVRWHTQATKGDDVEFLDVETDDAPEESPVSRPRG